MSFELRFAATDFRRSWNFEAGKVSALSHLEEDLDPHSRYQCKDYQPVKYRAVDVANYRQETCTEEEAQQQPKNPPNDCRNGGEEEKLMERDLKDPGHDRRRGA